MRYKVLKIYCCYRTSADYLIEQYGLQKFSLLRGLCLKTGVQVGGMELKRLTEPGLLKASITLKPLSGPPYSCVSETIHWITASRPPLAQMTSSTCSLLLSM